MQFSTNCPVCRLVRFYLLLSVPLIAMLGLSSLAGDDASRSAVWFARVELIDFLAFGSLLALIAMVGYRAYTEFWRPKQRTKALDQLRQRAELDSKEM